MIPHGECFTASWPSTMQCNPCPTHTAVLATLSYCPHPNPSNHDGYIICIYNNNNRRLVTLEFTLFQLLHIYPPSNLASHNINAPCSCLANLCPTHCSHANSILPLRKPAVTPTASFRSAKPGPRNFMIIYLSAKPGPHNFMIIYPNAKPEALITS